MESALGRRELLLLLPLAAALLGPAAPLQLSQVLLGPGRGGATPRPCRLASESAEPSPAGALGFCWPQVPRRGRACLGRRPAPPAGAAGLWRLGRAGEAGGSEGRRAGREGVFRQQRLAV